MIEALKKIGIFMLSVPLVSFIIGALFGMLAKTKFEVTCTDCHEKYNISKHLKKKVIEELLEKTKKEN